MSNRLDATAKKARTAAQRTPASGSACLECGEPCGSRARRADFCSSPCRKAFNNRRMTRGAELYDLVMANRYDRELATELGVYTLITRMTLKFHEQDEKERAGRKSWRHPKTIIRRHPYLKAEVLKQVKRY